MDFQVLKYFSEKVQGIASFNILFYTYTTALNQTCVVLTIHYTKAASNFMCL